MKTLPLLLLATSLTLCAQTEEQLDKRFAVAPNGRLVVDVGSGSIEVTAQTGTEIVVSAYRKVSRRNKAEEEEFLRDHPVTSHQDGNSLTIRCQDKNNGLGGWFGSNRMEAKYKVSVPAAFNIELKTSGGSISASGIAGETRANTSGGGLRFARLHGPLDGNTSGGGIRVEDCEGALNIRTSGGGIEVTGGSGSLEGHTSGGSITVKNFGGSAQVETSGGGVTLENVTGKIEGSTSGGSITARFAAPVSEDVSLETSGGGVTVRVTEGSAFNLDASTSGGGVSSDLPVSVVGKLTRGHLSGPVNGGGKTLHLRSSGGGIHVKKL